MTYEEKEQEIRKLAKRMSMLNREIELSSLDIATYAVPLAKGQFPTQWSKDTNKLFQEYSTEMLRIAARFSELFKDALDAEEAPKEVVKRRKKRK